MNTDAFKRYGQAAVAAGISSIRRYPRQWAALALVLFLLVGYRFLLSPPSDFSPGTTVAIAYGTPASLVAQTLADTHIIAHPALLQAILRLSGSANQAQAGTYRFNTPEDLITVAYRLITGSYGLPPLRVTFLEGSTVHDMATQITQILPSISEDDFLAKGGPYEGYLFPDTYFLPPSADATSIVTMMRENFNTKTAPLSNEIRSSGHTLSDIITLASLIEKEARTTTDKRTVAGILLNRLKLGMPLQVDAAKETYAHVGLPATPICNPGLDSIEAVLNPTKTNYLYYLTGNDGKMHYATTFAGHQANLRKYLSK